MKTFFVSLAAIVVILACTIEVSGPISEYFSKKDLKVITSTYNPDLQTRTILYGNSAAVESFKDASHKHKAGAVFKLYTYKECTDPISFESNIKSTLLQTEIVTIKNSFPDSIIATYNRLEDRTSQSNATESSRKRISFITKLNPERFQK